MPIMFWFASRLNLPSRFSALRWSLCYRLLVIQVLSKSPPRLKSQWIHVLATSLYLSPNCMLDLHNRLAVKSSVCISSWLISIIGLLVHLVVAKALGMQVREAWNRDQKKLVLNKRPCGEVRHPREWAICTLNWDVHIWSIEAFDTLNAAGRGISLEG